MVTAKPYFPLAIPHFAVSKNIDSLVDYRNNAVHYYNDVRLETVIYGLAQTSIVNFRDLVDEVFRIDIADGVSIILLPLSFSAPPDPIQFIGQEKGKVRPVVAKFLKVISDRTAELEKANVDTGRFLTVFSVKLESTKKIQSADIVVGVSNVESANTILVTKKIDPNDSHPLFRKEVCEAIGSDLRGVKFTTFVFDALVHQTRIKVDEDNYDPRFCWPNKKTKTFQYSNEIVTWIKAKTAEQVDNSVKTYKAHVAKNRQAKKMKNS